MEGGSIEERALAAACEVAAERGVPCGEAAVISAGSNALVHLRPSPVVARVMTGTVVLHDDPQRWLGNEVAVLGFLAPSGMAVAPSSLIDPGPYQRDGLWMTFCEYLDLPKAVGLPGDPERLGRALRDLHRQLSGFSGELPGFVDLQHDVERLLGQLRPSADLAAEEIESLQARLLALGETVFGAPWPAQALHGDATLSNLLWSASGHPVWNDFEDTFRGPVQWDLAGFAISLESGGADAAFVVRALAAYGGIEPEELAPFTVAHGVYDKIWSAYDAQRRA